MPLAIRSVNRRVGSTAGFDADAAAYIRAVQNADGAALEPAVARAINAFVLGCKADEIWTPIKTCCILMGARTLSGALTALVGSAPTNNGPFVSGDYDRKTGLKGNGSTKYLDTGRANNADGQNDNHNAVYVHTAPTAKAGHITSGAGTTGQNQIFYDTYIYFRNRTTVGDFYSANPTGFVGMSRASSTSVTARYSSANKTITGSSQTPNSANLRVFDVVGFGGYVSNARISFYSIGTSLTLATLETRVSDLYTAIGNAIA